MNSASDELKILAIDTSTGTMTVSLLEGERAAASVHIQAIRNHSIQLVPTIQQLLKETGWEMKQLHAVAAGSGPGSYTGIRIGTTVAKTMAWTLKIPVIGVSSLAAMAAAYASEKPRSWVVPLMDGRRGQVYTALYEQAAPEGIEKDGIRQLSDWLINIGEKLHSEENPPEEVRFVGEVGPFQEALEQFRSEAAGTVDVRIEESHMDAYQIGRIARIKWGKGEAGDVHSLVPNYTQLAEAEQKLLAKKAQGEN